MFKKLTAKLEAWISGLIRAELRLAIEVLRTHADDVKDHVSDELKSAKNHISSEVQKSYRKACALCGQMVWRHEPLDTSGKVRCMDCAAKGRTD